MATGLVDWNHHAVLVTRSGGSVNGEGVTFSDDRVLPSIARTGSFNSDKRIDTLEARIHALETKKKRADPKTCKDTELIALVRDWVGDKQLFRNKDVLAGLGIKPCQHRYNRIGSALRALGYDA
ncbi:MAG: hypothetical protein WC911_01765 [Thermoleophilia bacterium]